MGSRVGFSAGSVTLTPGTPVVIPLSTAGFDALAKRFPSVTFFDRIECNLSLLVASSMTVSAFLTYDAAGDLFASNLQPQNVERGQTTATDGGAIIPVTGTFQPRAGSVPGTIFLWLDITGSGSPFVEVRGYWGEDRGN